MSLAIFLSGCKAPPGKGDENVGTFKKGERAQVGSLVYNVMDTTWLVTMGEEAKQRVPKDRFLVVNLSVVNSGGKETLNIPSFMLLDDGGQVYNELADGAGVPQWMGTIRSVIPAGSFEGNILFDAPPKHYKLKVSEEVQQKYGYIDIPLEFIAPPSVDAGPPALPGPTPPPTRR